ncbi:MAG: Rrf2 family transcriptional regulator [Pseudomonadales bacterium]|jgi:Rrf2 family nitric oxide-sensitive transcriptional repressor|nr:Rrf2 family transcriptional regulator [Pseudomonadales bacterium]
MRLTSYTDFALRALIFTGAARETVTIATISAAYGISKEHLRKVVNQLAHLGYLITTQGRHGGLTLGKPAEKINLRAVVEAFETSQLAECFDKDTNTCPIDGMCKLKHALRNAQQSFLKELENYHLSDLVKNPQLQVFVRQRTG